jgi:hypothetical protein
MQTRSTALVEAIEKFQVASPEEQANGMQERLRERVYGVVDAGRALNWPPERVLIAVKELAARAGLHPSGRVASPVDTLLPSDELLAAIIRWTIEHYYERRDTA